MNMRIYLSGLCHIVENLLNSQPKACIVLPDAYNPDGGTGASRVRRKALDGGTLVSHRAFLRFNANQVRNFTKFLGTSSDASTLLWRLDKMRVRFVFYRGDGVP